MLSLHPRHLLVQAQAEVVFLEEAAAEEAAEGGNAKQQDFVKLSQSDLH